MAIPGSPLFSLTTQQYSVLLKCYQLNNSIELLHLIELLNYYELMNHSICTYY